MTGAMGNRPDARGEFGKNLMTKLLVGTPCYNGMVTTQYLSSMLRLQHLLLHERIEFSLVTTASESLITRARNFIVSQFLDRQDFTHLLFIDSDIGFDPTIVPRYLNAAKDIVAGIYPLKHFDLEAIRALPPERSQASALNYVARLCENEVPNVDGFARAESAGTGFMLIRRNVLEAMARKHSELKYERSGTMGGRGANLYALFDTSLDRDQGLYLPEDYTFCNRWRAMGGEIWVDVRSKFTHVGTFEYHGDFSALLER
jgi:hypothetical protein